MEISTTSEIGVDYIQHMGSDVMIAHAARVSTQGMAADQSQEGIDGLIKYLIAHRHGTPFEHGALTIRVHAPIFVWREWHRHRIGFSYNEESARYKQLDPLFYLPPQSRPMFKVDDWKPGRPKFRTIDEEGSQTANTRHQVLCENLRESYELAYGNYEANLGMGFDPGLARDCLPVGIYSACYVTCNPRSVMAFLSLRTHEPDAKQVSYPLYEIDIAARKLESIFAEYWPITHAAFLANGRVAP